MSDPCAEMHLLVQADVDGELSPAEAARVGAHLQTCAECAGLQAELAALSAGIRREASHFGAPASLRAQVAALGPKERPARPAARPFWSAWPDWVRGRAAAPFGAGFALAACLMVALLLPRGPNLPDEVVAGHIRALQPGHLMDVVSTDQHTVKPWFDGRLDFAPPVKDLKAQGFPLTGARLDYLAGHPAAVLVYGRRQHIIDVYVWPETGAVPPASTSRNGYNMVRWNANGMAFWAVSDLDPKELDELVSALRSS